MLAISTPVKPDLILTAGAAEMLGISPSQFKRLATTLKFTPDDIRGNPHYRCAAPMKLYLREKVAALKTDAEAQKFFEGAARRRLSAQKAVETKLDKIQTECVKWKPVIHKGKRSLEDVVRSAIRAYNEFGREQGSNRSPATRKSDPEFLARITRNYIRHELTDYDEQLGRIAGRAGTSEAYEEILRPIVDDAVDEAFPGLNEYLSVEND